MNNTNIEIERKFLVVTDSYKSRVTKSTLIRQGYLTQDPERAVRVRIKGEHGYITIKSLPNDKGWSRYEFETEIPVRDAEQLLTLCLPTVISKVRHIVPCQDYIVEIDQFLDDNEGLVMAEIELQSENQQITLPDFLAKEVTGDIRYYNQYLASHPYKKWTKQQQDE